MANTGGIVFDEEVQLDGSSDELIRDVDAGALHLRRRIPVGILGATGSIGQRLVSLLAQHRWFEITALSASERALGKPYKEAVSWRLPSKIPETVAHLEMQPCVPKLACRVVFSALDSQIAGPIEEAFAREGYVVISCAKSHRLDLTVPLVVPEVNPDHLELVKAQGFPRGGMIVTKPNCAVTGLVIALRPLALEFGLEALHVVTMQSISGAGFPGPPSSVLLDNIVPYISGEEERIEKEPLKIFGAYTEGHIVPAQIAISAQTTRVPITDGHLEVVSVKLKEKTTLEGVKRAFCEFVPHVQELRLPSSPRAPIHYFEEEDFPQPRLHRELEHGMAISIGRLQPCQVLDYKFVLLSHNTIRGGAGGAILTAEYLAKTGHIFW